jgi:hypothetical protein
MASKKKRSTKVKAVKTSDKQKKAAEVLELSASARAEIAKLLKDGEEGTITRLELETGLEEVDQRLKRILGFIRHFL